MTSRELSAHDPDDTGNNNNPVKKTSIVDFVGGNARLWDIHCRGTVHRRPQWYLQMMPNDCAPLFFCGTRSQNTRITPETGGIGIDIDIDIDIGIGIDIDIDIDIDIGIGIGISWQAQQDEIGSILLYVGTSERRTENNIGTNR